jgi:hypothetical protein
MLNPATLGRSAIQSNGCGIQQRWRTPPGALRLFMGQIQQSNLAAMRMTNKIYIVPSETEHWTPFRYVFPPLTTHNFF